MYVLFLFSLLTSRSNWVAPFFLALRQSLWSALVLYVNKAWDSALTALGSQVWCRGQHRGLGDRPRDGESLGWKQNKIKTRSKAPQGQRWEARHLDAWRERVRSGCWARTTSGILQSTFWKGTLSALLWSSASQGRGRSSRSGKPCMVPRTARCPQNPLWSAYVCTLPNLGHHHRPFHSLCPLSF